MKTLLALLLLAFPFTASAASPWDGTWTLDFEHSQLTGDTFSYSRTADGMWNVSSGGAVHITFATDDKPYRSFSDHDTMTAHQDGPRNWTIRRQHDGKEWEVLHEELSTDGQTLTDHDITTDAHGDPSEVVTTYQRIGGAPSGFEGQWKSIKMTGNHHNGGVFLNTYVLRSTGENTMRWELPNDGLAFEGKLDGSRIDLAGPDGPSVQITRPSDHELKVAITQNGKVERVNQMTLAPDGQSFTLMTWDPAKPQETKTGLYRKQP